MNDPTNWNVDENVGSFAFANHEEAKKAELVMNRALQDSYNNGRRNALEEAAKIAGAHAETHDALEAAHHRQTPQMFDPVQYGLDMEVVKWSRDAAMKIRARSGDEGSKS